MPKSAKPRKSYRPKRKLFNAFEYAVESVTSIADFTKYYMELRIKNHAAMHALTHGYATKTDMDVLLAMHNIMEAFRRMDICTPISDEILAAKQALVSIVVRSTKVLAYRPTGPEIVAINTLMELHDELMPGITCKQMEEGIELANRIIREGDKTALPTVGALKEKTND